MRARWLPVVQGRAGGSNEGPMREDLSSVDETEEREMWGERKREDFHFDVGWVYVWNVAGRRG